MATEGTRAGGGGPAVARAGQRGRHDREGVPAIADAAAQGARLVVFPETVVPYYPYFSFVYAAGRVRRRAPAPVRAGGGRARAGDRGGRGRRRAARGVVVVLGVNERDHGSLYNTQLVFDADGTLVLKRRKITPTYHERMVWGQGDGAGLQGGGHRGRARRRAGLLGALQPARPLRADGAARGDPLRAVPGLAGGADLRRPDGGHHPPSRAGIGLLRGQRHRLAHRRADRGDHAGGRDAARAARRLLHRHRLARGRACSARR